MTDGTPRSPSPWARRVADHWIARRARPDAEALARVASRVPATVVTGGSAGIGLAIAQQLAPRTEALILVARDPARLMAAADDVRRLGTSRIVPLALDLRDPAAPARIAAVAEAAGLYVDEVVNNAGVGLSGQFAGQSDEEIEALVDVNVQAATRLMRAFLPDMLARGRGGILNVASLGGYTPGPYQAAYYASKAYLISLTRAVAYEERGRGVRISVVSPGPVETAFHAKMGAESSLYRWLLPSPSAATVARAAIRGYDWGLAAIHPGLLASAGAVALAVLPRIVLIPVMGWLLWPWRADADDVRKPRSDRQRR